MSQGSVHTLPSPLFRCDTPRDGDDDVTWLMCDVCLDTEDKKKMYEGFDANFKASPYLEQLLKKSKDNAAM